MKDSQQWAKFLEFGNKYIKANNERFSTTKRAHSRCGISISRRIMKDSQPQQQRPTRVAKYIKANNERFSTELQVDILEA